MSELKWQLAKQAQPSMNINMNSHSAGAPCPDVAPACDPRVHVPRRPFTRRRGGPTPLPEANVKPACSRTKQISDDLRCVGDKGMCI